MIYMNKKVYVVHQIKIGTDYRRAMAAFTSKSNAVKQASIYNKLVNDSGNVSHVVTELNVYSEVK